jgi:hypothetical protein
MEPLIGNRAKLETHYVFDYDKNNIKYYKIIAEIIDYARPVNGELPMGYLTLEQVGEPFRLNRNYAINHCYRRSPGETCNLGLTATLNGVGFDVDCTVK